MYIIIYYVSKHKMSVPQIITLCLTSVIRYGNKKNIIENFALWNVVHNLISKINFDSDYNNSLENIYV